MTNLEIYYSLHNIDYTFFTTVHSFHHQEPTYSRQAETDLDFYGETEVDYTVDKIDWVDMYGESGEVDRVGVLDVVSYMFDAMYEDDSSDTEEVNRFIYDAVVNKMLDELDKDA